MKKKFFYPFLILSILFFDNKPWLFKNFPVIINNLVHIKKLHDFSENTHEFFRDYYRDRNQNIKKILSCSVVLIFFSNHSIKSLKDIFKKETLKKFFCSSIIRLTGYSIVHFTEGLFSYTILKNTNKLPFYRNPHGVSTVLHEFNIDEENKDKKNSENTSKSEIRPLTKKNKHQVK